MKHPPLTHDCPDPHSALVVHSAVPVVKLEQQMPPVHLPALPDPVVHWSVLFTEMQPPDAASQRSVVQGLPSSAQTTGTVVQVPL